MAKTISIIIPVYNSEAFLARCLDSVLENDFKDIEIILINDGSSDSSWKICQKYQEKYPEIVKIFSQENKGIALTRNRGLMEATSKYIMFIDNDDFIERDYLKIFLKEIESKNLDLVIGGYKRVTDKQILFEVKLKNTAWSRYMIIAPWAKIYRKDFVLENKIKFLESNIGEDIYFNLQAINFTEKISIINYAGYNWFNNEKSVSNTQHKQIKNNLDILFLLDSSYNKLEEIGVYNSKEVEFYFLRLILWYILYTGKNSSYDQLLDEFKKTINWLKEKYPTFQKNKYISLFEPKGEILRNRVSICIFMILYKLKVINLFFRIYAK